MGWLRFSLLAVVAALSASIHAAPAPTAADVDALVGYETQQVLSNGVTRTERWSERLIRRGDTVWAERVLPPQARHDAAPEPAGHKHFDFDRAARLVTRDASGQTQLRFVDREHRIVVSVPKAEYGAVGFDGRWDAAASIVPAALAERMQSASGRTGDARWRTERAGGWSHRVLWSDAQQLALRVESQRDDGSVRRVVSVTRAAPGDLPWSGIAGYTQKEYDDFMD
jgi:hypothetical protein